MTDPRKQPATSTSEFVSSGPRMLRPLLEKCESHSSAKPEQKMYDFQIAAAIYALIFGLISLGAWTTSNGFSNQANCLARTANILALMSLCPNLFGVENTGTTDACHASAFLREAMVDQIIPVKDLDITCAIQTKTLLSPIARQAYAIVGSMGGALGLFGLYLAFRKRVSRFIVRRWQSFKPASRPVEDDGFLAEEDSLDATTDVGPRKCSVCNTR